MILKITRISLSLVLASLAMQAHAATKVFLLGGQSNMSGHGEVAQLTPPYSLPQPGVKFWNNATGSWYNLQGGFGATSGYFGPEVSFGYTLANTVFPQDDIYLVKYALGATSLAVDWNPDGSGPCYNALESSASAALQNLSNADLSPQIAGMIWMQGESDANYLAGPSYATNLKDFIGTVRSDFATPDMRFVLGRISSWWYTIPQYGDPGIDLVRAAQVHVTVPGDPGYVGNTAWVDTDDLQMSSTNPGHYGTQGHIDLGILFANEFIQTPEPSAMVLVGTGLLGLVGYWWRKRKLSV